MRRVSILGLGYIGLPTAILASEAGYEVFGCDLNKEKVAKLNAGNPTINEPDITKRLQNALNKKQLKISEELEYADCFIVTVPTPLKANKTADLSYVFQAADQIAKRLMPGNLIILESTIPVGTTERVAQHIEEISGLHHGANFFVAHCPERAIPGTLFKELIENDRIIGGLTEKACNLSYKFYSKFIKGFLHITDDKSAELIKLIENSSRDVQIAFANQVAAICDRIGINPYQVIELANKHPRVSILKPTCGVGGHCLAVDPYFLIQDFPKETDLLQKTREINNAKPQTVIKQLLDEAREVRNRIKKKPTVLGLGLTFKPNVDDLRESPALIIAQQLRHYTNDITFIAHDPYVEHHQEKELGLKLIHDIYDGIAQADIILILVNHQLFVPAFKKSLREDLAIIDTCGLLYDIRKQASEMFLGGTIRVSGDFEKISF